MQRASATSPVWMCVQVSAVVSAIHRRCPMTRTALSDLRLVFPLVLWLTGCSSEALTHGTVTETFELRSVGVRPVPAVYDSSKYGYATAVRGSFTFSADGQVVWA